MKRSMIAKMFSIATVAALAVAIAPAANATDRGCTNASIKGTFAFQASGTVLESPVALLDVLFAQTFDGNGGLTSTGVQSHNGNILQVTQTGTYTVNPDCSGSYTAQVGPVGITVHFSFLIVDSGNELKVLSTDPNTILAGTARRLFPAGDWRQ
jgi:hypothetical protein